MTSLYRRASQIQVWMLRVIEGAVRNTAHAHPEYEISPQFARGVAKRAVGTLTAGWPVALAAPLRPSDTTPVTSGPHRAAASVSHSRGRSRRGSVTGGNRRSPLIPLWRRISKEMRSIRESGDMARYAAYQDVLRMIAAEQKGGDQ